LDFAWIILCSDDSEQLAEKFLATRPSSPGGTTSLSALEKYAQILLLSNESMFID